MDTSLSMVKDEAYWKIRKQYKRTFCFTLMYVLTVLIAIKQIDSNIIDK